MLGLTVLARMQTEQLWQRAGDYEKGLDQYRLSYESLSASQQSSRYQLVEEMVSDVATDASASLRQMAEKHHLVVISMEEKSDEIHFALRGNIGDYLLFWDSWNQEHPLLALDIRSITENAPFIKIEGSVFSFAAV